VVRAAILTALFALCGGSLAAADDRADAAGAAEPSAPRVVFETSAGSFTVSLRPDKAPRTVANFLEYVDAGFYDGTIFHRVIPGFVVQGGGFDRALNQKPTLPPVVNESDNGLENVAATVAMARKNDPDSATSQFFINLQHNDGLDGRGDRPGYTVFGTVSEGMDAVRAIAATPTRTLGRFRDVPEEDVVIRSARRVGGAGEREPRSYTAGEDYIVLDPPAATRDPRRIEVVEAFSYGCPYCYQLEPYVQVWRQGLADDVDFRSFHAVWNDSMRLYAQAHLTARQLGVLDRIHAPLFNALQAEQQPLRSPGELANFFETFGVERADFIAAFRSPEVQEGLREAEKRVADYNLSGVPQFIVNGKYRVDPLHAGGRQEMLDVVDYLIERERSSRPAGESNGGS